MFSRLSMRASRNTRNRINATGCNQEKLHGLREVAEVGGQPRQAEDLDTEQRQVGHAVGVPLADDGDAHDNTEWNHPTPEDLLTERVTAHQAAIQKPQHHQTAHRAYPEDQVELIPDERDIACVSVGVRLRKVWGWPRKAPGTIES